MSETKEIKKFGTFLGVFTPSILTILGLVMYLRFGWVVGNVGLGLTFLIVLMASSITFITGLSASAIATNIEVKAGGEYFLVSRSLGIAPGGAIGIPLYFCRTLSVTFYCLGLAEALLIVWPVEWGSLPPYGIRALAALIIVLITLLSGKSAEAVLKVQIPIMILVGLSILALFIGVLMNDLHAPIMEASYVTAPEGFWFVFAVFFPAVTGFTAGIGMSGDLKDPRKSIPRGTIGAVLAGLVIYLLIPIIFAVTGGLSLEELTNQEEGLATWTKLSLFGALLVFPAVWGAILSSAFGSILGGPRVIQALANDGIAPKFLGKLTKSGQPRTATLLSGFIALLALFIGDLNVIAQFVSVLFLTLYVTINLSAAFEQLVAEPSYRPKIRVPWYISLLGALGAVGVMYLISPIACIVALLLEVVIYIWLRSRSLEQQWGDVGAGFWMNISRYALIKLANTKMKSRNWRPLMLLFVNDIKKRIPLVKIAAALGLNHGIVSIVKLMIGEKPLHTDRLKLEAEMHAELEKHGLEAFCEVHQVNELHSGIIDVSKAHGIANLRTNTVIFGWSEEKDGQISQMRIIKDLAEKAKNILLVRFKADYPKSAKRIDIWWGGQENNGDLKLLLAYLLKLNREWENAKIFIRSLVRNSTEKELMEDAIAAILPKARINAEIDIINQESDFISVLHQVSKEADVVFLGLPNIQEGNEAKHARQIESMSSGLRISIFVQNNGMSDEVPILLKV